jgi:uncharacterized coiled-coil protein SlyX
MFADPSVTADTTKGVIDIILQHGITGAMLIIVLVAYFRKDKALTETEKEHNDTVEGLLTKVTEVQTASNALASKLVALLERLEQRERERDAVEKAQGTQFRRSPTGPTR